MVRGRKRKTTTTKPNENGCVGNCPHLSCIDSIATLTKISNPSRWTCDECTSNTESVWLCLQCGHTGCGRTCRKMHAQKHYDNTHHPVVMHINHKMPFCYDCDNWILNDHERGYIAMFREQITRLQNQIIERSTTRSGTEIRSAVSKFQFVDPAIGLQRKSDKRVFSAEFTAKRHFELTLMKRCISNWKTIKDHIPSGTPPNGPSPAATAFSSFASSPQRRFAGRTGLRNVGNTCYLNATVMALSSLKSMRRIFTDASTFGSTLNLRSSEQLCTESVRALGRQTKSTKTQCGDFDESVTVLTQLQKLFLIIWSGKFAGVCPAFFVKSIMASSQAFRGYMQHDAHEFYTTVIDLIDSCPKDPESVRELIKKSLTSYQKSLTTCHVCLCESNYSFPGNISITLDIDAACRTESTSRPHRNAKHDIPRHCHLIDCLHSITEPVELAGSSLFRCESNQCCGGLVAATKRDSFQLLAPCVVFHINRTKWDSKGKRKVLHQLSFPLKNLDLSCILSEGSTSPGKYDLKGVVLHHGRDIDQGHYTAICYREEIGSFVAINDLMSEIVLEKDITEGNYEGHPYLLFYEMKTIEEKQEIRQQL